MRKAIALLLLICLAACANPACRSNGQDGGIGGTGKCVEAPLQ